MHDVARHAGGGYEVMEQAFASKQRAGYGRAMVINPLHAHLPKLCIMIQVGVDVHVDSSASTRCTHLDAQVEHVN